MKGSAMSSPRRTMRSSSSSSGVTGLLYPLLVACLWAAVVGYKPVIIIHGLFDSSGDFKNLLRFINQVSDPADRPRLAFLGGINSYCCFCWPHIVNSAGLTACVTTVSAWRRTSALEHGVKNQAQPVRMLVSKHCVRIWRFWIVFAALMVMC